MNTTDIIADREACAELLKKYFAHAKRDQHGQPYRPHPRYKRLEIWLAAADVCMDLKADPYDFIRAAFLYSSVPGGPFPQNLASNCARRWYAEYRTARVKAGENPDSIFKTEISGLIRRLAMRMVKSGRRPKDFLLDTYFTKEDAAPAFTRVLLLPNDPEVLAKFGRKARSEIVGNQKLLTVLQELNMNLEWLEHVT